MEETMSRKYDKRLKASVVYDICELGKSTSRTAKEYNIPLKTVEKWVTAYHKDPKVYEISALSDEERISELEHEVRDLKRKNYYLITYMDAYSRKIVAWNLEEHQTSNEMIETLKKAVDERNPEPGLIIHSDKGSQMRSESYREFISNHNFAYSYTSLNHSCDENAAQESFHASLKKECIYQHKIRNYLQAYSLIYNYIENFYNTKRIHSSINYLSPCDFEKSLLTD